MSGPQAILLPDGRRLHLHHGPIDLIIDAWGERREAAFRQAIARFENLLQQLVDELPDLRRPVTDSDRFQERVTRRMAAAVCPFADRFITPMAAVAGSVADEILDVMTLKTGLDKAYVNNGGDIAFHLSPGQRIDALIAGTSGGEISVGFADPYRGMATSGWRGRSNSLGIADAVSVIASSAASADAAATLIANAVDLPGHAEVKRQPATDLFPDSDLGDRLVTTSVGTLSRAETRTALDRGAVSASGMIDAGLIAGAVLFLKGESRQVGALHPTCLANGDLIDA